MEIELDEQQSMDFDWFAVDVKGQIAHFASGGGRLPNAISRSRSSLAKIASFMRAVPLSDQEVKLGQLSVAFIDTISDKERYLEDFAGMARRGLYSYDKQALGDFSDMNYRLVYAPSTFLQFSQLPREIADLLVENNVNCVFGSTDTFDAAQLD